VVRLKKIINDYKKGEYAMYAELQKLLKEPCYRGWRLEKENGVNYLSKFEELFNDNEIRIYIHIEPHSISIVDAIRIKNYTKSSKLECDEESNTYVKEAALICKAYEAMKKTAC